MLVQILSCGSEIWLDTKQSTEINCNVAKNRAGTNK
jgi:hypothetical protein